MRHRLSDGVMTLQVEFTCSARTVELDAIAWYTLVSLKNNDPP